jgi:hypothetical protein
MQQASWYGSSATPEWYTEAHVIERVVRVLGVIDLDPCSNPPPYNVPATLHMSRADGGLNQRWHGRVYMNPPYGRVLPQWMAKLAHEICEGRVTEAITLTKAATDARWFAPLWMCDALCFWRGRMHFSDSGPATFPSVLGYFGPHRARFAEVFGKGDLPMMNTAALRRKLAAIRTAEDAMAKAERDKKPMSRDVARGKVLAYRDVLAWLDESEGE